MEKHEDLINYGERMSIKRLAEYLGWTESVIHRRLTNGQSLPPSILDECGRRWFRELEVIQWENERLVCSSPVKS